MTIPYGPTTAGWYGKPLDVVQAELDAVMRTILGDSAGTEPDGSIPLQTLAGQQISALTDAFSAQWDLLQAVVSAFDPNQATAAQLDALCALTGTLRNAERFSTSIITCSGTPLTILPIDRAVKDSSTGSRFLSTEQKTIVALPLWTALTAYVLNDRVTNANLVFICAGAGTSAASGGPSTESDGIVDGSVTWNQIGKGTGAVDVLFEAEQPGPVGALALLLNEIATPVSGWSFAINLADAMVGAEEETSPALRARREAELAGSGGSTVEGIRADILKVNEGSADPSHAPPTTCKVFFNDTDYVDTDGLPPHSVEVLVQDGTDADIALAVWKTVGAGTATYGNQTSTITDSEGNPQVVHWTRPTPVPIFVVGTVYYDASKWPAQSDALVAQYALSALLTYGDTFQIGLDVRVLPLGGAILRGPAEVDDTGAAVPSASPSAAATVGLLDVTPLYVGTAASPVTSTPVAISRRQIATFDSARCALTATTETP